MRRLLLGLLLLAGCDRAGYLDRPLGASGPYALEARAAWLLAGEPAVAFYDPVADDLTRAALDADPVAAVPTADGTALLVLDAAGGATWIGAETRRYDLGASFTAVTWAPDGHTAIVHHAPGAASGPLITNPNQIAILDVARPAGEGNPVRRTLRSFGAVPRSVVIAPAARVAGAERQLAWVLSERYLALLDLAAPTAREVIVHLTLAEDAREVVPAQVVAGEIEGRAAAFVRAQGSQDVFALTFPDEAAPDAVPRPSLNLLPAGGEPSDLLADAERVFTANGRAGTVAVLDPVTGRRRVVDVGAPVARILPFTAPRADGEGEGRFALLWAPGGEAVVFADLDRLELRAGQAVTPLRLEGRVVEVAPLPGRRGAAARLENDRLVLLDFDDRTATPLVLAGGASLGPMRVDPDGDRVYALVQGGPDGAALVTVGVETGAPTSVALRSGARDLLVLPAARRLLIDHGKQTGEITVVPMGAAGEATERSNLLLEGMFDR